MSDQVFEEWVPYRLELRPATKPGGGSWRVLDSYQRHLRVLGLPDYTKASAFRVAAEHVRDVAESHKETEADDLAEQVAAGAVTPEDALKKRRKRPDPDEVRDEAVRRQKDADELIAQMLHRAALAIYEHDWLGTLKPLAEDAVAKRDQDTWTRIHEFAQWLRDPMVGLCALAAAMANATQDCDPWLYMFGDAGRGLYRWQLSHAGPGQATPGSSLPLPGGGWRIAYSFKRGVPFPTIADIADHAEAWGGAGLFSADDVIRNMHRVLAEQDREIDALMGDATPRKKRGVVMIQ